MLFLRRQIDYDGDLEKFLLVKGQRRVMLDLEEKREKKHQEMVLALSAQLKKYMEMTDEIRVSRSAPPIAKRTY